MARRYTSSSFSLLFLFVHFPLLLHLLPVLRLGFTFLLTSHFILSPSSSIFSASYNFFYTSYTSPSPLSSCVYANPYLPHAFRIIRFILSSIFSLLGTLFFLFFLHLPFFSIFFPYSTNPYVPSHVALHPFFFFLSYPPSSLLGAFIHLSLVQYFGRTFCHGRGHSSTLDAPHVAKPRHSLLRHAYYCGAVSLSLLLFFLEVEV